MPLLGPPLPAPADLIHDADAVQAAIEQIADALNHDFEGLRPVFLTVMHGGLIFAGQLAPRLGFDCDFDYIHATRYRGEISGSQLIWLAEPRISLEGRTVLLVDDILDEGITLKALRDWCLDQGAATVVVVVLTAKEHDRCHPDIAADYYGLVVPDRYVFGFGMDYQERGRNLPSIWALKEPT
jgi:hypoxanthine phosphoribosyltransferase